MKKDRQKIQLPASKKKIDLLLEAYGRSHEHPSHQLISWISIPLILFSLLGLVWAIPFPYLAFLGRYNGFLNWASFLIAFSGYYYYRLSPVLSYMTLLLIFILALGVVQLEKWELAGGPALWLVCTVIFVFAAVAQFIGYKIEGKRFSFLKSLQFLFISPVWLMHFLSLKIGLKWK